RPADRKFRLVIKTIYQLEKNEFKNLGDEGKKKELRELSEAQDKTEKDKDGNKVYQAWQKAADEEQAQLEFVEFGKKIYEYFKIKRDTPSKDFNSGDIYKYIRRKDFLVERKYVDKEDWSVVAEPIYLSKLMDQGEFAAAVAVDMQCPIPKDNDTDP